MATHVRAQEEVSVPREDAAGGTTSGVSPLAQAHPDQNATPVQAQRGQDTASAKPSPGGEINPGGQVGEQPKRILWIIPNYRAVSANAVLPPMKVKDKFWLATQDTFDYSAFIFVGALSGISLAQNSEPALGRGAAGYGRYYWRVFTDSGVENYLTEAAVPAIARQDPRYYTLGKGGLLKRTGYAVSRLLVTRNDAGHNTFNISEIVGSGAAAGIGNAYYPPQSNPWVKTYQRWGTQVALDGFFNILKEFWPDLDRIVFHGKY